MTKQLIDDPFFDNEEFQEAFNAFIEMRKKIRKPATEYAMKLAIKELRRLSNNNVEIAIGILNQSTFMSWQGLFPLKDNDDFNPTRRREEM